MVVINADGSVPEMCGNGIRCVALHVASKLGSAARSELVLETDAGPKTCVVDRTEATVSVDMGVVRWLEDIHLEADGETWDLSLADAGNPHAITRKPAPRSRIEDVGPILATHPRFPLGTNVEFATVRSPTEIDLVVWERGVGITDACGTGACATVVVGVQHGWAAAERDVLVRLPGGILQIRVDPTDPAAPRVQMTGPAQHVFSGRYDRRTAP
jgi:diaminopimelate epimerase